MGKSRKNLVGKKRKKYRKKKNGENNTRAIILYRCLSMFIVTPCRRIYFSVKNDDDDDDEGYRNERGRDSAHNKNRRSNAPNVRNDNNRAKFRVPQIEPSRRNTHTRVTNKKRKNIFLTVKIYILVIRSI